MIHTHMDRPDRVSVIARVIDENGEVIGEVKMVPEHIWDHLVSSLQ